MRSATKPDAMIAPIMIPTIAPVDSFGFEEIDDEALVGEVPVVMTEGAEVDTVEKMEAELVVLDICTPVVLGAIIVTDNAPSEPNAMSCCEVSQSAASRSDHPQLREGEGKWLAYQTVQAAFIG